MIDPAAVWIEIRSLLETRADLVANQVELACFTRYYLFNKITVDRGKELLALESANQTIGNILLCK